MVFVQGMWIRGKALTARECLLENRYDESAVGVACPNATIAPIIENGVQNDSLKQGKRRDEEYFSKKRDF